MQFTKSIAFSLVFSLHFLFVNAQLDTAAATQHALVFADSIVKANFFQDWKTFTALSIPSAVKYYGGKDAFRDYVSNIYYRHEPTLEEKPESVKVITLMNDQITQWQCVIEKVRSTRIDDRQAKMTSYLVGQSLDNGATWKFIDVSHNDIKNVIFIMPQVFGTMPIPEGKTVFEDDLATQEAAKTKPKKKSYRRKR